MSEVVHTFTTTVPRWQPYVVPVDFATATDEQHAAMQTTPSNKGISPYVLTTAHDPETLAVRSPLFNLIMYGKDGLAASERELGAVAASVVNRCVYCAAVHASRFNNLTKRTDVIEAVFADGLEATLDEHLRKSSTFRRDCRPRRPKRSRPTRRRWRTSGSTSWRLSISSSPRPSSAGRTA